MYKRILTTRLSSILCPIQLTWYRRLWMKCVALSININMYTNYSIDHVVMTINNGDHWLLTTNTILLFFAFGTIRTRCFRSHIACRVLQKSISLLSSTFSILWMTFKFSLPSIQFNVDSGFMIISCLKMSIIFFHDVLQYVLSSMLLPRR